MKKLVIFFAIFIIIISFLMGVFLYPEMPEEMASHWNVRGEVDGYMPRFWGLFLMPIVSLGLFLLFLLIPRIDPLKENIAKFREYFDWFILLLLVFLFYIYFLSLAWNLGYRFDMTTAIVPAVGLLFFYIGVLLKNAKRNWFIGIRTPWTMSSERVWDKTHRLGARMFKACGIIAILGLFLPFCVLFFSFLPIIFSTVYLVFYSYFEFKKEKQEQNSLPPNIMPGGQQ